MPSSERWFRLEALVTDAEPTASRLWEAGALGVEVQDRHTFMEDGSIAPVPEGRTRLIAFFDEASAPSASDLAWPELELVSYAPYDDRSWETAWKAYFRPQRLSPRSVVGPPWEEFEAPSGGTKLVIEPGMAFGTGTHETTQLCAEIIDELLLNKTASVLDVGCGSGILSMLAYRLGARPVVGVDVDATAIEVARENLAVNALEGAVSLSTTPLSRLKSYDLVIANILAHILLDLRHDLVDRVAPGGTLVMSGITVAQEDDFRETFDDPDVEVVDRRARGEWIALTYRRV